MFQKAFVLVFFLALNENLINAGRIDFTIGEWNSGTSYDYDTYSYLEILSNPNNYGWNIYNVNDAQAICCEYTLDAGESCNPEFEEYNGNCYYFFDPSPSYLQHEAEAECASRNSTLVSVETAEEYEWLRTKTTFISQFWRTSGFWDGEKWCWNDGSPCPTEEGDVRLVHGPNANKGIAQMYSNGTWGYVCDGAGFHLTGWPKVFCRTFLSRPEAAATRAIKVRNLEDWEYPTAFADETNLVFTKEMPSCSGGLFKDCGTNDRNPTCGSRKKKKAIWVECGGASSGD